MVQTRQYAPFDKDLFDPSFVDELVDEHLFQGVERLTTGHTLSDPALNVRLLKLHLEYSSVCTITNFTALCKVGANQSFAF